MAPAGIAEAVEAAGIAEAVEAAGIAEAVGIAVVGAIEYADEAPVAAGAVDRLP